MEKGYQVQMLSVYQLGALKHLYDKDIWPQRLGMIHETGDLILEYEYSAIGPDGLMLSKTETIKIPKTHGD